MVKGKILSSVMAVIVSVGVAIQPAYAASVDNGNGNAKSAEVVKQNQIKKASNILKSDMSDKAKEKALKANGWEIVSKRKSNDDEVSSFSNVGCGDMYTTTARHKDSSEVGRYYYLVKGHWEFLDSCDWDKGSDGAYDVMSLGVVDSNDDYVGEQPYSPEIMVYDEHGNDYPTHGSYKSADHSSMSFVIQDEYKDRYIGHDEIGHEVEAWFFIDEPSNPYDSYVKGEHLHTWNDTEIQLQSIDISWPWAFNVSWERDDNPSSFPTGADVTDLY